MQDSSDYSSSSRAHDEPDLAHPTLVDHLFAVAAVGWPLVVYAAYLWVAIAELWPR
ncbi:MAG: hypothetical protein PVH68_14790 [Armatimonadota bacterium]|jgi:hypothetical protein